MCGAPYGGLGEDVELPDGFSAPGRVVLGPDETELGAVQPLEFAHDPDAEPDYQNLPGRTFAEGQCDYVNLPDGGLAVSGSVAAAEAGDYVNTRELPAPAAAAAPPPVARRPPAKKPPPVPKPRPRRPESADRNPFSPTNPFADLSDEELEADQGIDVSALWGIAPG